MPHGARSCLVLLSLLLMPPVRAAEPLRHGGVCDASAAVALDATHFVVADDESNVLRIYATDAAGEAVGSVALDAHLAVTDDSPEADVEGAARLGDRIYWITSHGRNKNGKLRPNRYRFFATDVRPAAGDGGVPSVMPVGRAVDSLLDALLAADNPRLRQLELTKAAQLERKTVEDLAPKDAGLNLEGLAATADGGLFLGLRNPRPEGKALLVPLRNPAAVIGDGAAPHFGDPILLDLGGLGIRSLEYLAAHKTYLLVAGSHDEVDGGSRLYRWSGDPAAAPELLEASAGFAALPGFNPEALFALPGDAEVVLLSDDGARPVAMSDRAGCTDDLEAGSCECKAVRDPAQKGFRSLRIVLSDG